MKKYRLEVYRLDITAQTFTRIDEIITYKNLRWIEKWNGIGGCAFSLNIDDPKATSTNLQRFINHIIVKEYQDDSDIVGRIVWSGMITKVSGGYQGNSGTVDIEANTALYHLTARYTDLVRTFTATEQATILWTLINESQSKTNGWLGMTQGTLVTSITRDRTYERGRIAELLMNMANLKNGCSFTFDPLMSSSGLFTGWQFNTYYPTNGVIRSSLLPLEIGTNIDSVSFNTSGEIFNSITGVGSGTGAATLTSLQTNSGSQLGATLREAFYTNKDVSIQTTLDEQTVAELNRRAIENFEIKVTLRPDTIPYYGDYNCGDYLQLNIQRGYMSFNYLALVTEISVSVDDQGVLKVAPTLAII